MEASTQRLLLVVEDDVVVARALSRALSRCGFSITIARSCLAARSLKPGFEVGIFDLDLPDGNGFDLASQLKAEGIVQTIWFFTGSSDHALLVRAARLGSVVLKTNGIQALLALLKSESGAAPESGTRPNRGRDYRASSSSSLRKLRTR